ncbi:N-acetylglucosamine-6-phosphate deacetylase [Terrimonas sp. NA20]|uniref:N-acetylglucosamine-6-phosphate deacetylase n=1 Tax=Terrimonas ginsenosidimutans TaxID=2908004 RepID=A0ABS9KT34_9BACT|nr:N-acetylglucosamine-6-phosphate deacetylase [Terrimonas ginsenosidimutans]MCG2615460.1 N-acetylglucosamine-6-phosphate deacetylase [Terrimonas ginsenosidimutans]
MDQQFIQIVNGKLITPSGIVDSGSITIRDGVIIDIGRTGNAAPGATIIDAEGNYVSPGFVDIHVHGGGGYDFMDGHELAFLKIAETHARFGTTAMLPTTLTSGREELLHSLHIYEEANRKNKTGAQFIGMHLEGPYFAMNQRGAQDPLYIRDPDPDEYREVLAASSSIRRWSAAPELPGALAFGDYLCSKGVLPAIAHTEAIFEDAEKAFHHGYSLITHLYSAMLGVTRKNAFRYAGVIESAYLIDEMDVEIIADGVHLPAPLLKLVHKIKGAGRTALITDAMRAAGTNVTESVLGNISSGLNVIVEDGVAKLPDRSSFAGSVATADRLVRNMMQLAGVSLMESIQMMSATPARIMGLQERKGTLRVGMDADIILFDEDIDVKKTFVNGALVFDAADQ